MPASFSRAAPLSLLVALGLLCTGCLVSSEVVGGEAYRADRFTPDSLHRHGLAVLPTVTEAEWDQYRRPFQKAFDDALYALADSSAVVGRDASGAALNRTDAIDRYPSAFRTYQETGVVPADLMRSAAEQLDARYLLAVRLGPPYARRSYAGNDPNDELLSTTYSMRARGIVWDAATEQVVWEGSGGASGREGSFTVLKDGSLDQSKMAGEALARRLFRCPAETALQTCR
jgi:hypothetical protein